MKETKEKDKTTGEKYMSFHIDRLLCRTEWIKKMFSPETVEEE